MNRYDATDFQWSVINPLLLNRSRDVPRANDERLLHGTKWILRSGAPHHIALCLQPQSLTNVQSYRVSPYQTQTAVVHFNTFRNLADNYIAMMKTVTFCFCLTLFRLQPN